MSMVTSNPKRRTPISLSKALATLGYEQWSSLDPDDEDENHIDDFMKRLDKIFCEKYDVIENKRMLYIKRQIDIDNMDETSLKKRLQYGEDNKIGKDAWQEERELHEAYQFVIREYQVRHKQRSNSLTPKDPTKKKKDRRRSAEVCSMYRGGKSYYEKIAESLPGEEISLASNVGMQPSVF